MTSTGELIDIERVTISSEGDRWKSTCKGNSLAAYPTSRSVLRRGGESNLASLSRRICRWLQLIHKNWLAPLENAVFSTPWARKRYRVAQLFRSYVRATNC